MFQVNSHTLLIAVDKLESCPPRFMRRLSCLSGRCLCRWGFNFQHLGAHVSQHHCTKGAGGYADHLQNLYSLQWAWHSSSSLPRNMCCSCTALASSATGERNTAPQGEQREAYHASLSACSRVQPLPRADVIRRVSSMQ